MGNPDEQIIYLPHARLRMQQRHISENEVEYCLHNHDVAYTDKAGNPILITRTPKDAASKLYCKKQTLKL